MTSVNDETEEMNSLYFVTHTNIVYVHLMCDGCGVWAWSVQVYVYVRAHTFG